MTSLYQYHVRAMADYNQTLNRRLYDCTARLSDSDRQADRGAFFGSIHRTLDHLLLTDRIWVGRFRGNEIKASGLDEQQYAEFDALRDAREELDQDIIDWVATLGDAQLEASFAYHGIANPEQRFCPLWFALSHFFNHQTHHRGQVTVLLSQLGIDYGTTDLITRPGYVTREAS